MSRSSTRYPPCAPGWTSSPPARGATRASSRGTSARPPSIEVASTRINDQGPLIRLGRLDEAGRLLAHCQEVFEDFGDISRLSLVLGARAELEHARGNPAAAAAFARNAIRLDYTRPGARSIAVGHQNLAVYLRTAGSDPAAQRAHGLAAALIYQLAGMTHDVSTVSRSLAADLRLDPAAGSGLPGTVAAVVAVAEQTEGVHLGRLLAALEPDPQAVAAVLALILDAAAGADPGPDPAVQDLMRKWEPTIAAVAAAAGGDAGTAAQLAPRLDELAGSADWAALVAVLRRILDGESGDGLLDGLDPIDTAIASQVLSRLRPLPPA